MRLSRLFLLSLAAWTVLVLVCCVSFSAAQNRRKWSLKELRRRLAEQRAKKAKAAADKTAATTTTSTTTKPAPTTITTKPTTTTTTTLKPTTTTTATTTKTTNTPQPTTTRRRRIRISRRPTSTASELTTTPRPTTTRLTTTTAATTTTTATTKPVTTTRRRSWRRPTSKKPEVEEKRRRPRGFFRDAGKTRDVYRELLDGRNELSDGFRNGFMRDCGQHNSKAKCKSYFYGVIHTRAKIFYKFGVSLDEYEEEMSQVLERCLDDLNSIEVKRKDDDLETIGERQNRWRLCVYNQTINTWFLGSIGEVKLAYLMVCPGTIQRCLTVFDDKLTSVLSYIYDNHIVSLADIHSRAAQIVYKCSTTGDAVLRMWPFRRCIDIQVVALDSEVREWEPKKSTFG